jgi:hypothetical protein
MDESAYSLRRKKIMYCQIHEDDGNGGGVYYDNCELQLYETL